MIIINSAAYTTPEIQAEFGKLPPCLLPIGNRKLLEYQVSMLRNTYDEKIVVSLPENFKITIDEQMLFTSLEIDCVFVPSDLSLAHGLLYILDTFDHADKEPLRLLHGDTFLDEVPKNSNLIAVAASDPVVENKHALKAELNQSGSSLQWCGYFSFSSSADFISALRLSQGNFKEAVRIYAELVALEYPKIIGWYDLGDVETYFVSRAQITTQRVFNSLRIENGTVRKSGTPHMKILAETEWFKRLPSALIHYTPQLIDSGIDIESGTPFYVLEYLHLPPLNEILVHGRNPNSFWKEIFNLISIFFRDTRNSFASLNKNNQTETIQIDARNLYEDKTFSRLEEFAKSSGIDLNAPTAYDRRKLHSLHQIAKDCISRTLELPLIPTVLHGDFCFSNILYDSQRRSIKVIDPRGLNQKQELTILGDQKYDLAKVCHSVIGLYDFIFAGRYQIENKESEAQKIVFRVDERLLRIQEAFTKSNLLPGITTKEILPLTVLLFLSMLPLHADRPDRQQAMLINALRLYTEYLD
ncbi:hypothetical protein [Pseudomonas putida]|uniref:hypothetical protein n=1 Tax=Pseudomonas putida TaxID=303 RepID=UPI000982546A|nr:hypothetical protein [Pseudomonas putida]OMQ37095.1 hypothetical protein BKX96_11400 [Pseudomonas putida]